MKNGMKKFAKGMFAIFTIKLFIVGTVLLVQACTEEKVDFEDSFAKNDLIKSFQKSKSNFSKIKAISSRDFDGNSISKSGETLTPVELIKADPSDDIQVGDFNELTNLVKDGTLINPNENTEEECINENGEELCLTVYVDEAAVEQSMQPSLNDAKNYLYSKGYTDADIAQLLAADNEGPAVDESALVPTVMALIAEEENPGGVASSMNFSSLFITSAHATSVEQDTYDCALRAFGITAITDVVNNGISSAAGKKALKKAIRKVASRVLGWVGAAWAAYEFGDCMGWW